MPMNAARKRAMSEAGQQPFEDLSSYEKQLDSAPAVGQQSSAAQNAARSVAQSSGGGGNLTGTAGGALMATGNPYAMGAGAGLMAYGAIKDKKQKEKMAEYNAEVDRLNREQNAMGQIAQLAQRFKSL